MSDILSSYIKTELFILIPILWLCGKALKTSKVNNSFIPLILGGAGVFLAGIYVFSVCDCSCFQAVLSSLFASITQGLLCAGASVYANELFKTFKGK